ncbi:MAG: D-inositol 3-phosphate glycosyltransferase [bacterium ADurb.Bin429]|nr:MAG: D-inositol 3-phosphate glycosyltransferase [bacterium ADurb.Bin429]
MLRSTAQAQRWAEYVSFDEDVTDPATFLADCDLLAIPALEEDTGRAALEAAAMGRPTVATRVSGLETLIADGHTGLLVPPGDPRAFADALELLLASPALRAEMGRQARVRAEERYGIGTVVDALEAALPTTTRSRVGR